MFKIPSLDKLIHELSRLPGVGPKSAQRLTHHLLKNPHLSQQLRESLIHVEENIRQCKTCFNYTDNEDSICHICKNPHRSQDMICVVEQPEDILQIESSGAYTGLYHVLHGAISPLEGITPEKLRIKELLQRLRGEDADFQEIILAVDSDLEGDTTVLYLNQQLEELSIRVTRLAQGIPMGSDIDYIDNRTLHRALSHRTEV
ncbi:MAG: recombination protein RecR [Bdellovibrionales bacterium]|nr:recombination mediator RecR [Bdellovibrionales bacterium]NQZ17720.1 recombination protein RecR [Bdellovibrionales bacterium]